jgi:diaminopimelate epimerase
MPVIAFTKMHGAGNDFVVLDRLADPQLLVTPQLARAMADRQRGIGCDQLLVLEAAAAPAVASYRILNADGSAAQQCGNGARCLAAHLHANHGHAPPFLMQSPVGPVAVDLDAGGQYRVDLGPPRGDLEPSTLQVGGETVSLLAVSMGNPHAVIPVDALDDGRFEALAPLLSRHPHFPDGCNIEFVQPAAGDDADFTVRVWERGVGETLACGSGACAVLVALRHAGRCGSRVRLRLPGGVLTVEWPGPGCGVWLSGPVATVYTGQWLAVPDAPDAVAAS